MSADQSDQSDNVFKIEPFSAKAKNLYLDAEMANVAFLFDPPKRTKVFAHKILLALGSDVFKTMFYGQMKEVGDITIVDASVSAFEEFLQFFYLDAVKLTMENIVSVVNLGKKYNVPVCLSICAKFLADSLTINNVHFAYDLANLHDLNELNEVCEEMITTETEAIFESTSFLKYSKSVLSHILKFDTFSCAETKVLDATMAWVKAASGKNTVTREMVQTHLGDLFKQIRFASMKIEEFAALIPTYGDIFSFDEYKEIVQMIASKDYQPKIFNGKRRSRSQSFQWDKDAIIEFKGGRPDCYSYCYKIRDTELITFSVNKQILFGEFVCAELLSFGKISRLQTQVIIEEYSDGNKMPNIVSDQAAFLTSKSEITILMQKPVLIKAGHKYTIQLKQIGEAHEFHALPLKTGVQTLDLDITIQFHGNQFGSFIKTLKFNRMPDNKQT